jgi:hypothetical protein
VSLLSRFLLWRAGSKVEIGSSMSALQDMSVQDRISELVKQITGTDIHGMKGNHALWHIKEALEQKLEKADDEIV